MATILIIDDDPNICEMLSDMVARMGHDARWAVTLAEGLSEARAGNHDIVFLDVRLPDGNGLTGLSDILRSQSSPEVIILTGEGNSQGVEMAVRNGAWDYIQKPASMEEISLQLVRALQYREEKRNKPGWQPLFDLKEDGVIGSSPQMRACTDLLAQVADTNSTVLLTGETGTGKELFASALHRKSRRANKNFVVVDCSALPETLVESALFGYEKGAFTGADKSRQGLIKQADGGTLFLDEVGEMPLCVQKAFLRVIQERRLRPIGATSEIESNFRLIAATNRNLLQMTAAGAFRSDLLFRFNAFKIELPPLRQRIEDIQELALYHLEKTCHHLNTDIKGFTPEFLRALTLYPWPGNVRELFHAIERASTTARTDPTLYPKHLPDEIRIYLAGQSLKTSEISEPLTEESLSSGDICNITDYRENMDKQYLQRIISRTNGNIRKACQVSGLSRSRLYELLKCHGIAISG
ncbi:MAG: sigma-54 dependent transcriptional regulator [Pseudomonadota bacterium]